MRLHTAAGLLPGLFILAAIPARVEGQESSGAAVTEAAFLAALDQTHPALALVAQEVATARAQLRSRGELSSPELHGMLEDPDGPSRQTDWTLSWQLPSASRSLEVRAQEQRVEAAEAALAVDRLALRLEMRRVYAAWALASARVEQLRIQGSRLDDLARRERLRAERGEASGLEASRIELEASASHSRRSLAESEATRALAEARRFVPELDWGATPVLPDLPAVEPPRSSSSLGHPAPGTGSLDDHPSVVAQRAALEASEHERSAAGRFVASPEIIAGWQQQKTGSETLDGPVVGFTWPIPLFGKKRSQRELADAEILAATARLENTQRRIAAERVAAETIYRRLTEALGAARLATESTRSVVAGTMAAFRLGEASLTDLLDTLRSSFETEEVALELYDAALEAHRNLERVSSPLTQMEKESQ